MKSVMLHDGSWVKLHEVAESYDATDQDRVCAYSKDMVEQSEPPASRRSGRPPGGQSGPPTFAESRFPAQIPSPSAIPDTARLLLRSTPADSRPSTPAGS